MASSFDLRFCHGEKYLWQRRLFPLVSVGPMMGTLVGKVMTLLWQVFLIAGPHPNGMRRFLNRIRSITTDLGTERLLAGVRDLLPEFYVWIGAKLVRPIPRRTWLFPRALAAPGWCHINDTLVRRGQHNPHPWKPIMRVFDSILAIFLGWEVVRKQTNRQSNT